ncbi:MAG: glycosyltransferase, partial [Planctomycetaceae bacterium]|nr:glycosyltransferase [Planctomycetaceae bacterium]
MTSASSGSLTSVPIRVTVIIPALNEAGSILFCINSARVAGADEVLVVDGGSEDETPDIARAAGVAVHSAPRGRAFQQNLGASLATGDVLFFLHADCQTHPDSITEIRTWIAASAQHVAGGFRQAIENPRRAFRVIEAGNAWRIRRLGW